MNRTHKLSLAIALALTSSPLLAMGLGQIQVRSQLGQPLVAEIPLSVDSPAEAASLQVSMAPAKDFQRAGISLNQMAVPLQFTVATNARGERVIRVTTVDPVREPYLDFLLQVNWSNGRLLREYTVLLDPPNYAPATPVATTVPLASRHPATAVPTAAAAAPAAAAGSATASAGARRVTGDTYGPVKNGETLTQVAHVVRPGSKVSMNQVMVALLAANPDAFVRGNINGLKRGAILRIPSAQQISARSAAAATAEVRRQIEDWRGTTPKPTLLAGAGETGAPSRSPTTTAAAGGRLQLVPPTAAGQSAATRAGVAGGTGSAAIAGLKSDLARTQESLASQRQQSDDLKARLKAIEGINGKNQQLLALKNDEIAELQRKLAQVGKTGAATTAAVTVPGALKTELWPKPNSNPAAVASAAKPAAAASMAIAGAAAPAASAAAAASAPAPTAAGSARPAVAVSARKPVAAKPLPAPAPMPAAAAKPWYLQVWALATGGLIVLLMLLLVLRNRRGTQTPAAVTGAGSIADQFGDDPFDAHTESASTYEGDAEVMSLHAQMAEYPGDAGLHLELVSLFYARRDVDGFEAAAEAMHAEVDPASAEWQAVEAMGEELSPHHPLFARASPADDPMTDAYAEPATDADDDDHAPPVASGYSFDFDLSPAHADIAAPGMHIPQPPLAGHDLPDGPELPSLDFEDEDSLRRAAVEDLPAPAEAPAFSDDPADTKLDLARAYLDMGDREGARAMLEEVIADGSPAQKDEAHRLLGELR